MYFPRLVFLSLIVGCAWLQPERLKSAQAAVPSDCSDKKHDIAIGGVTGFDALANPANTTTLRETCRVRLYIHDYIWRKSTSHETVDIDKAKAILRIFNSDVSADVELHETGAAWFRDDYKKYYVDVGVKASIAHVDLGRDAAMDLWTRYVDEGRRFGLQILAPIFSPNSNQWKNGDFAAQQWNNLRAMAQYGGGLTIDTPPHYFLHQPAGYQRFVEDEIRWANSRHLHSTFIISPSTGGDEFLTDTQQLVGKLVQAGAVPKEYVIQNYNPHPPADYPNPVGNERNSRTVAGVALWVAQHCSTAD